MSAMKGCIQFLARMLFQRVKAEELVSFLGGGGWSHFCEPPFLLGINYLKAEDHQDVGP